MSTVVEVIAATTDNYLESHDPDLNTARFPGPGIVNVGPVNGATLMAGQTYDGTEWFLYESYLSFPIQDYVPAGATILAALVQVALLNVVGPFTLQAFGQPFGGSVDSGDWTVSVGFDPDFGSVTTSSGGIKSLGPGFPADLIVAAQAALDASSPVSCLLIGDNTVNGFSTQRSAQIYSADEALASRRPRLVVSYDDPVEPIIGRLSVA